MKMIVVVLTMFFGMTAFAGFGGYSSTSLIGTFSNIKCSSGLTCTKVGDKFNMVAGGAIQSRVLATATTITSSQCGSSFYNGGAVVMKLPKGVTANLGCRLTFLVANASNFDINPDDADTIINSTNVTGDASRNATLGSTITLELMSLTQWAVIGINGTWADIN